MNSVMRAFPLLAIIAVVYSAVKAYQALVRISDGAAQGAKAFAAAQKEISESVGKETAALNRNFAVLKNAAATKFFISSRGDFILTTLFPICKRTSTSPLESTLPVFRLGVKH